MGRPEKIDDFIKEKIKDSFGRGLNKSEVCIASGISRPTLDSYLKRHKRFAEECELMKENLKMHAKLNIADAIIEGKDLSTSKYYLEKVNSDEKTDLSNGIIFKEDIPDSDSEVRFGEADGS